MEGYVETVSGSKRPAVSPQKSATPKKMPFLGISPLKEFNFQVPRERTFKVSVEGNIGAGKSTLIQYFEGKPGIETYSVSVALNVPSRWCNETQELKSSKENVLN